MKGLRKTNLLMKEAFVASLFSGIILRFCRNSPLIPDTLFFERELPRDDSLEVLFYGKISVLWQTLRFTQSPESVHINLRPKSLILPSVCVPLNSQEKLNASLDTYLSPPISLTLN